MSYKKPFKKKEITKKSPVAKDIIALQNAVINAFNTMKKAKHFVLKPETNPAQTGININYSASSEGTVKIEIKDLLGKIIYTNFINARLTDQYIPLSGLSSGMYLITFTKNKEIVYTSKIIKQD